MAILRWVYALLWVALVAFVFGLLFWGERK